MVVLAPDGSVAWRSEILLTNPQLMASGPNGEIYVGGDNRAYRFVPPSTAPDPAFVSGNGWRSMDPWAMAVQPDGALLLAGAGPGGVQMDWMTERGLRVLVRILPSGARDTVFAGLIGTGPCTDLAVNPGRFVSRRPNQHSAVPGQRRPGRRVCALDRGQRGVAAEVAVRGLPRGGGVRSRPSMGHRQSP